MPCLVLSVRQARVEGFVLGIRICEATCARHGGWRLRKFGRASCFRGELRSSYHRYLKYHPCSKRVFQCRNPKEFRVTVPSAGSVRLQWTSIAIKCAARETPRSQEVNCNGYILWCWISQDKVPSPKYLTGFHGIGQSAMATG